MRLGLYGGTFDPIHDGHLAVAREAVRAFSLEQLWIIPNNRPPHKQSGANSSYEHRLRMVELACAGDPVLQASDLERNAAPSYTIDTLLRVEALFPGIRPYFVIGADAYADVPTWRRWKEVLARVTFLVVTRPGYAIPAIEGATHLILDNLNLPVSSSAIRQTLRDHGNSPYLPPAVLQYIHAERLYAISPDPL
jgi:nicotinate-nucleotide adenylyltransferase